MISASMFVDSALAKLVTSPAFRTRRFLMTPALLRSSVLTLEKFTLLKVVKDIRD